MSVVGSAGFADRVPQPGDEEALRGAPGRSHQQTDAAHQRQTAAPQNLRRALEPSAAGAQQGAKQTTDRCFTHSLPAGVFFF